MAGWDNVSFMHLYLAQYLSPPDVVCLVLTSRDSAKTFDTADTWRAVTKAFFRDVGGARGHMSRKMRRKKFAWRAGDGAKARLSLLWLERTRDNVARFQAAHLLHQRERERRWILGQAGAVMRMCAYAARQDHTCLHSKLRLWTSATLVAAKPSSFFQERPSSHSGVRCDRCKIGPITGSCFRCTAGCCSSRHKNTTMMRVRQPGDAFATGVRARADSGDCEGCYTLCEACFSERGMFHPPHPFARLRPGFAEFRLSGPVLYEAVCGDCSFGSLILVRPLKAREDALSAAAACDVVVGVDSTRRGKPGKSGDLWAVPVRVEAAGPLPLSQVKSRIAAGDKDANRGLAFMSDSWQVQKETRVSVDS